MAVPFRKFQVRMSEQFFQVKRIDSVHCQPRGESVAQGVEGDTLSPVGNAFIEFQLIYGPFERLGYPQRVANSHNVFSPSPTLLATLPALMQVQDETTFCT